MTGGVRLAETLGVEVRDGRGMLRRNEGQWEERGLFGPVGADSPQGDGCWLLRNPNAHLSDGVWYTLVLHNTFSQMISLEIFCKA